MYKYIYQSIMQKFDLCLDCKNDIGRIIIPIQIHKATDNKLTLKTGVNGKKIIQCRILPKPFK